MLDIWLDYSDKLKEIAKRLKPSVDAALSNSAPSSGEGLLRPSYADELFRKEFSNQVNSIKGMLSVPTSFGPLMDRLTPRGFVVPRNAGAPS
jgi:hypothetical protein